jgi:NAD(P)-dependent dehydrogenase (short-subunit alcohol dehydrogenase family)
MALSRGKKGLLVAGAAAIAAARYTIRRRRAFDLLDKVVLVTSGSRGLGLLLAREFANRGARVCICGREEVELEEARIDLLKRGAKVYAHCCDATVNEQVISLITAVGENLGAVDVLVNNAGEVNVGPMEDMKLSDYEDAMRVHFWAPLYATLEVLPSMRSRRQGRIVNVSSIGGKVSVPHLLPYSASKFALVGLSEGLRSELMADNIYVTTVCPGLMRTGNTQIADFVGRNEEDYPIFAFSDAFPMTALRADTAARQIVEATIYGDAEIVLSIPARIATVARALFPEPMSETMALFNQTLPTSDESAERDEQARA